MSSLKIESVKKVLFQVPPVENFYPHEIIESKSMSLDSERSIDSHSDNSTTQLIKTSSSDSVPHVEVITNPPIPKVPEITLSITPRLSQDSSAILSTRSLDSITLLNLNNQNLKAFNLPDVNNPNLTVPTISMITESNMKSDHLLNIPIANTIENPPIELSLASVETNHKAPKPAETIDQTKESSSSIRSSLDDLKKSSNSNSAHKKSERRSSISLQALDKLKSLFSKKSSNNSRKESIISLSDSIIRRESQISNISRITDIYGGRMSRQNKQDNGNYEIETWSTVCVKLGKRFLFCNSKDEDYNYYIENHTIARIVTVVSIIVIICIIISIIVKSVSSTG